MTADGMPAAAPESEALMREGEFRLEAAEVYACRFETPLGEMAAVVDDTGALRQLSFLGGRDRIDASAVLDPRRGAEVRRQLAEYFQGRRKVFDLTLAPGGTPFQKEVWRALVEIPYGECVSYSDIARRIGRRDAVRAVGAANGANPIAIVIPSHRVIGRDGSLTGYGGGLPLKRWLLDHEAGWRRLPLDGPARRPPTAAQPAS
jgi:methylated-DNA-[protein]-cysteine S-methyltransferase